MENYGIVYVLVNEYMPGILKIGKTTCKNFVSRMRSLSSTEVPEPFKCQFACKVALGNEDRLEKYLHAYFHSNRINTNREFFKVDIDRVVGLLDILCEFGDCEDATDELCRMLEGKGKRPNIDYIAIGLKVGDKLYYVKDKTKSCTIASHNKVDYLEEKNVSLFHITFPLEGPVRPAPFWETESGKTLADMYEEHHNNIPELIAECSTMKADTSSLMNELDSMATLA